MSGARIHAFLMTRAGDRVSPVMADLFALLGGRGHDVSWSIGEELAYEPGALAPEHDLYLLKSQAPAALSVAAVLDAQGARILNAFDSCAAATDKVVAAHRLHRYGIPTPRTWAAADPARLAGALTARPVVVKPYDGYHGSGVRFLPGPEPVCTLPAGDAPVIVQERADGPGDLKVYVIGTDVFGVRKAFDADSHGRAGVPVALDPAIVDVARRCGAAFGFGLYGIDVVETPDGPVVIDVNHFPGYKGVPGAAERLADYVEAHLRGEHPLALPSLLAGAAP